MSEPFTGEIQVFGFSFAPKGWAQCNGQLLPIAQNQALFALLGTTYGGDGRVNFALPDLRGRVPLHFGDEISQGEPGGAESHTLTVAEIPEHTHIANASSAAPTSPSPTNATWANTGAAGYEGSPDTLLAGNAIAAAGGGQPHENRSPFLTVNFCIALRGIFPSRD